MNLIDKVILEWSYRTKKGYPDINNRDDVRIFESMFGFNINEAIYNKSKSIAAAKDFADSPAAEKLNIFKFIKCIFML